MGCDDNGLAEGMSGRPAAMCGPATSRRRASGWMTRPDAVRLGTAIDLNRPTAPLIVATTLRLRAFTIAHLFVALCETLGYDQERVVSVRVNPRKVVISHTDSSGMLCSTTHLLSPTREVTPSPHAEAPECQEWPADERSLHPPTLAV
jgi:hypothetical protein